MTCEQVQLRLEDYLRDPELRSNQEEVRQHVSTCARCSQYIEEQRVLAHSLRLVRESVPAASQALDATVIARYRECVEQRRVSSAESDRRIFPIARWAWTAAATVALAGAAFWFVYAGRKVVSTQATISTPTGAVTVAPPAPRNPAVAGNDAAKHRVTAASKVDRPKAAERTAEMPIRVARSMPDGFRSLMYCDALSCAGDMEMIRVQLPASSVSRQVPGFVQTSGSVTADVLVGPDGVARGIRFDEIEF